MIMYRFIFLFFLLVNFRVLAQNLVPNPGFEEVIDYNFSGILWDVRLNEPYTPLSYCTQNYNDYILHKNCTYKHKLLNWYTRSFNFNPINLKAYRQTVDEGNQPIIYDLPHEQPLRGNGAFNISEYSIYNGYKTAKNNPVQQSYTYLNNTLKSPLIAGKKYYVEFFVKFYTFQSDTLYYFPSEIGLLFSNDIKPFTNQELTALQNSDIYLAETLSKQIKRPASISSLPNRFYGIKEEWQRVCGFYTAQGGEKYIAIGNFNQNELWYYSPSFGVVNVRNFPYEMNDQVTTYGDLMIDNVRVEEYKPGMFFKEAENGIIKVCENSLPYQLSLVDSFDTYSWQNGSQEKTIPITESGNYEVTLDAFGCYITDSVEVVVEQSLNENIQDTLLCPQQFPFIVSSTATDSLRWSNGSTSTHAQYNQAGKHWVILENSCGIQTDTFQLAVIDTSKFDIPFSKKILFCDGNEIDTTLQIPSYFNSVKWEDGDTSHHKQFTDTLSFSVNIINTCIDTTFDFSLAYYPKDISLTDTFSCEGVRLQLPFSKDYTSYEWNTGDTTAAIYPTTSGLYYLTVATPCGQWSDSLDIRFISLQKKTLKDDTLLCIKGSPSPLVFSLSPSIWDSILWHNGSIDSSLTITEAGVIGVTVKNRCQTRTDSAQIIPCDPDLDYTVTAPNIITPNGDGKNECFTIECYNITIESLSIYSRYGKLMGQVQADSWCPPSTITSGMYYYLLTFKTPANTTEYLKGWIVVQE